jgi:hypothetical protein
LEGSGFFKTGFETEKKGGGEKPGGVFSRFAREEGKRWIVEKTCWQFLPTSHTIM